MTGILNFPSPPPSPPDNGSISSSSTGRRRKYCSARVIPSLRRHETMLFGSLKPVACQSQENGPMYFYEDEDADVDMALASLGSSMDSSHGSVAFSDV